MRQSHRLYVAVLALLISILAFPAPEPAHAADGPAFPDVLIVYDSLGVGTEHEGNVEALKRLLAAFRVRVTAESIDSYTPGSLKGYSKLIEVQNRAELMEENHDFFADLNSYQGDFLFIGEKPGAKLARTLGLHAKTSPMASDLSIGPFAEKYVNVPSLWDSSQAGVHRYGELKVPGSDSTYPYGVRKGKYAYAPFLKKDALSEVALSYVLKDWLQEERKGHFFLVFKEIYPFSDLELLERMSDEMFEAGIPFIVSVHPVFSNTDYPAMKRYIHTLKYVQSRNGTVLVESPVVASTIQDLDRSLHRQMEHFVDVLAQEGVLPLGMGAEMHWTYDEHYVSEGMPFFDSVILYPDEHPIYKAKRNRSEAFRSSLYSVDQAYMQRYLADGRLLEPLPMDTAITVDFVQKETELDSLMDGLKNGWIIFDDYKREAHRVKTATNEIRSESGTLTLNGSSAGIQAGHVETSSDYVYKHQGKKSFETWFTVQNKIFIVVIFVTLSVFFGFLIIGYRMYKRKFYK